MELTTDKLFILTCKRCNHQWKPKRFDKKPVSCPACKSYTWEDKEVDGKSE